MENCCFIGHRFLKKGTRNGIKRQLRATIERLIQQGVTSFVCGGSFGFGLLAGYIVWEFKEKHTDIKFTLMLPCRDYSTFRLYQRPEALAELIAVADEVIYLSEDYYAGCKRQRNMKMLETSQYLVAYMIDDGGTAGVLDTAREMGLSVINLAGSSE